MATELQEGLLDYLRGVSQMMTEARARLAETMRYTSYEGLVLDQGRAYEPQVKPGWAQRGAPKWCYDNTFRLVQRDRGRHGLVYCEGYAILAGPDWVGIPVQHAWAVDADGRVVDVTWPHPELSAYYGIAFDWIEVCRFSVRWGAGILPGEYHIGAPLITHGRLYPPNKSCDTTGHSGAPVRRKARSER